MWKPLAAGLVVSLLVSPAVAAAVPRDLGTYPYEPYDLEHDGRYVAWNGGARPDGVIVVRDTRTRKMSRVPVGPATVLAVGGHVALLDFAPEILDLRSGARTAIPGAAERFGMWTDIGARWVVGQRERFLGKDFVWDYFLRDRTTGADVPVEDPFAFDLDRPGPRRLTASGYRAEIDRATGRLSLYRGRRRVRRLSRCRRGCGAAPEVRSGIVAWSEGPRTVRTYAIRTHRFRRFSQPTRDYVPVSQEPFALTRRELLLAVVHHHYEDRSHPTQTILAVKTAALR